MNSHRKNSNSNIRIILGIAFLYAVVTAACHAESVKLTVAGASGVLSSDKKQTTYLRVGLRGNAGEGNRTRPAVNAGIVLDRSGSMTGEKIERAKEAARMFIEGLQPEDIISVILYDN